MNEEDFVDPLGYPFTLIDYLRVFDSFLGGMKAYDYVSESRDCISNLQDRLPELNYTFKAWDFTDTSVEENYTYSIYDEELPVQIYNATEAIS